MGGLSQAGSRLRYGVLRAARKFGSAAALALGLAAAPAGADEITLAALGDSLTQGYGLPADAGFVPQLEAWLAAEGVAVDVLNAGVSGDTTAGGLARVGWTLTPEVDALMVALGGNDFLRGIDPDVVRSNLAGILAAAREAEVPVLLVGMEASGNYGPAYKADFDAIYPALAAEYGVPLIPYFLQGLADLPDREAAREAYIQPDGLHPNAEGVAILVDAMGPAIADFLQGID